MSWRNPVVWSQGMFLQPHHFQQEARYVFRLVDERARCLSPHAWGFDELILDEPSLTLGLLGITRASGVLPDGTPFSIPHLDPPPQPLPILPDLKSEIIYMALPVSREGVAEVEFGDASTPDAFRTEAIEENAQDDTSTSDEAASIQVGRLKLRLIRAHDLTDAYTVLGIAHVAERRTDLQVVLDRTYIPPAVSLDATEPLAASTRLLHGLVAQRSSALASRMGKLSSGVSELADFMMLQVLNRAEPLFRQHSTAPNAHPFTLFTDFLQLAGELSTFVSAARRPPEFPAYRHDDLRACFAPLVEALRTMLSTVLEQNAVQIELVDRQRGVFTAVLPDLEVLRSGSLVLAVAAHVPPDQLRQRFVTQTKVGPVDRIRDLVNLQLPGIGLQSLPVAPRQLPYHAGHFYFELDRNSELWRQLEKSGSLAMHVAGDFPALELELWAIRPQ